MYCKYIDLSEKSWDYARLNMNNSSKKQILFEKDEKFIIDILFKSPDPLSSILDRIGYDYPKCWVMIHTKTRNLVPRWGDQKPGDIDIIVGSIVDDELSLENLLAIEVKIRKITSQDKLNSFPSGRGTTQAAGLSKLGFNKVILLHVLLRDPKEVPEDAHPNWNIMVNTSFFDFYKACENQIVDFIKENDSYFGYAWIGLGQVHGRSYSESGGVSHRMAVNPPEITNHNDLEIAANRTELLASINMALSRYRQGRYPCPVIINV